MTMIYDRRMTVVVDGPFVVLLIGFRINKFWKIHKWLPAARGMFRMVRELEEHPEFGCLATVRHGFTFRQYWRSFEHLEAYARNREAEHWPVWVDFNRRMANSRGDVGIWHETFLVAADAYEAIYSGMPAAGLGLCGQLIPVDGATDNARARLKRPLQGTAENEAGSG